jgi:hypothetical protein
MGELSTEEASVTIVSWEWMLPLLVSLSSLELVDDVDSDDTCRISIGDTPSIACAV